MITSCFRGAVPSLVLLGINGTGSSTEGGGVSVYCLTLQASEEMFRSISRHPLVHGHQCITLSSVAEVEIPAHVTIIELFQEIFFVEDAGPE